MISAAFQQSQINVLSVNIKLDIDIYVFVLFIQFYVFTVELQWLKHLLDR